MIKKRPSGWRILVLLMLLPSLPVSAQDSPSSQPSATTITAPQESREVVAEGRAAIGVSGVPAAREAAIAQALRSAVEKTLGVYVSARTLTHNYQLLHDEVTTRAGGYAALREIVSEQVGPGEVRVTIRALVSLQPLAKRLRELNLTRAWRVRVESEGDTPLPGAVAVIERTLSAAGFVVLAGEQASGSSIAGTAENTADLVVQVSPQFQTVAETSVDTAVGPMNLHSVRGEIVVRATQAQTREVVAAFTGSDVLAHVDENTARTTTADRIMGSLAPRMAGALLVLPARESQPVTLVVSHLAGVSGVGSLHDALRSLPGVRAVTRRSWENAVATWELDVNTDAIPLLARALEDDVNLLPFGLSVQSETRARITATVQPSASARRSRSGG